MSAMVVIQFTYTCSHEELAQVAADFVENVRPTVAGLEWKIFVHAPERNRSGGLYLFRDLAAARAYAEGTVVAHLRDAPFVAECTVEVFETMREPSVKTGAPVG
jgi:hypothetical protein